MKGIKSRATFRIDMAVASATSAAVPSRLKEGTPLHVTHAITSSHPNSRCYGVFHVKALSDDRHRDAIDSGPKDRQNQRVKSRMAGDGLVIRLRSGIVCIDANIL
jgi:hypothetical protein